MNRVTINLKPGLIGGAALCLMAGSVFLNACVKVAEWSDKHEDRKRLDKCLKATDILNDILKKTEVRKEGTESVSEEEKEES